MERRKPMRSTNRTPLRAQRVDPEALQRARQGTPNGEYHR